MRVGLDTSVVLRLLVGEPEPQAERALKFIVEAKAADDQVVVSDIVASETYFALQYHYGVPKAEALRQLSILFESGDVVPDGCASEVLRTPRLASAKPGFVDRLIRTSYLRDADRVVTFEQSGRKLARTLVLKP